MHPDKALAEKLHDRDPKKFGDPNHKPEIAIALTEFELFVGWKPLDDIQALCKLKPLQHYVREHDKFNNETLRDLCRTLLLASPEQVKQTIEELCSMPEAQFGKYAYIPSMLGRLSKQYTEFDNGNLVAPILMNYMSVSPGQAVCVPADGIHAYISGDIVECMARSDNVLNTGFCPRADRDSVDTFTQALSFTTHSGDEALLSHSGNVRNMGRTIEYAPPFNEFNVLATTVTSGERASHAPIAGPSLMIVTAGSGELIAAGKTIGLSEGQVWFIGQGVHLSFSTDQHLAIYRAYAE